MRQRTVNITTDVEVDVDIEVDEILEQLSDGELESLGLARVSRGLRTLAEAVWDFHETEHGGLLNGCRHKPCADFDYDAAEIIRKAWAMTNDKWRLCESCGITELSCRRMHRDTHAYCCYSCAHPDNELEGR